MIFKSLEHARLKSNLISTELSCLRYGSGYCYMWVVDRTAQGSWFSIQGINWRATENSRVAAMVLHLHERMHRFMNYMTAWSYSSCISKMNRVKENLKPFSHIKKVIQSKNIDLLQELTQTYVWHWRVLAKLYNTRNFHLGEVGSII